MGRFCPPKIVNTPNTNNAHSMDDGGCDATIAEAAAAVAHVQNLSQEVGFTDAELSLFGFDVTSAETEFWWLEEEEVEEKRPKLQRRAYTRPEYMASTWGRWLLKLEDLSAANDGFDHVCREARDFASHFRVSYDIFLFILEAVKPVFSGCTRDVAGRPCPPLKLKVRSSG